MALQSERAAAYILVEKIQYIMKRNSMQRE